MKIKFLIITFLLSLNASLVAQTDYFLGKRTYCNMPDTKSKELFDIGIECIHKNLYIGTANKIFRDLIEKDSTFCDAYFFAGYTYRLSNMNKEAVLFYYVADSLSQNKSIEYKQNLATTSLIIGNVDLSRKKFKEITTYFPESPEGFYGLALTSTTIGDFEYGLENIKIAESKYKNENKDAQFLKAILLSLNNKYNEAIVFFEKVEIKFFNDDNFNGNYALSLYEVGTSLNDEKMLKMAKMYYENVKNKNGLSKDIKSKFEKQ